MTYAILVAVDGEAGHRAALDWAAARAARDGARLRLVHVVERAWGDAHDEPGTLLELAAGTLLDEEKRVAVQRIREAAARRVAVGSTAGEAEPPQLEVTTGMLYGHVARELAAAATDADLLVIGTPSEAERAHAFIGSLAVRVAAAVDCTVVAVPHGWSGEGKGVVVGVDGDLPSEAAVAFASDEAAALREPLTIVCAGYLANPLLTGLVPEISVADARERIVARAAAQARAAHPGLVVFTEVVETSAARGIVAESDGSHLLVIGTHNRRGAKRVMLGSVGHDVLLNARTPIAVVRGLSADAPSTAL